MPDYTIPKTLIASSDPPSICAGLSLFPPFPSIGAGIHTGSDSTALFNKNKQVCAFKAKASAEFGFFMGLCGPGYGIRTDMAGKVQGETLSLTYDDDAFVGGFAMGMTASVGFHAEFDVYKIRWRDTGWDAKLDVTADIEFDLPKFIFDFLLALVQGESSLGALVDKVEPVAEGFETSLAIVGAETGEWRNYKDGEVRIDPMFSVPINLWPLFVGLSQLFDESGVGEVVLAINALLNETLSSVGIGPTLGIGIPLTLKISQVALDDTEYTNPQTVLVDHANEYYGWSGTADKNLAADPQTMTVTFQHNAGFSLDLGAFASIQVLEFLQVGANVDFSIIQILDIAPQPQPFVHTLSNKIGLTQLANASRELRNGLEMVDVEFA